MKKTTMYLPEDLRGRLSEIAGREKISVAELTRELLREGVEKRHPTVPQNWLENFPFVQSNFPPNYAKRTEEYLREGFGEW